MIYRKIVVDYYINRASRKVYIDYDDAADPGKYAYESDIIDRKRTFRMFKNNGKVSVRDCSGIAVVDREAERLLHEQLKIESEAKKDHERAVELAKIVNAADFEHATEWVEMKVKYSHSGWYDTWQGEGRFPSRYVYEVPAEVEKEATELFDIRRKHQEDLGFYFHDCGMTYRVTRESDHENIDHEAGIESWIEEAENF